MQKHKKWIENFQWKVLGFLKSKILSFSHNSSATAVTFSKVDNTQMVDIVTRTGVLYFAVGTSRIVSWETLAMFTKSFLRFILFTQMVELQREEERKKETFHLLHHYQSRDDPKLEAEASTGSPAWTGAQWPELSFILLDMNLKLYVKSIVSYLHWFKHIKAESNTCCFFCGHCFHILRHLTAKLNPDFITSIKERAKWQKDGQEIGGKREVIKTFWGKKNFLK